MSSTVQIYVKVSIAGCASAWRPAAAVAHPGDVYEIVSVAASPGERPEFGAGDRVTCRPYELTDHDMVLVAHQRAGTGKEHP